MAKNQGAMGRNPFEKKSMQKIKEVKVEKIETPPPVEQLKPKLADWLLVDLPAETYILGLKTMLLTKDIFESKA